MRMSDDFTRELVLHMQARYPIIFVVTAEEDRALEAIEQAVGKLGREMVRPRIVGESSRPAELIRAVERGDRVLVLDDVHRWLDDSHTVRALADLAAGAEAGGPTAVVVAPWLEIPMELERVSAVLEMPLPDPAKLGEVLEEVCAEVGVLQTEEDSLLLVRVGQGLTAQEARRAFRKAMLGWPEEADEAQASVERDKRRALRRSKVLEHVETPASLDDVGGLDQLKTWLKSREDAFSDRAREYGLPAPRGLLLMGIQGCGKSLTSKAVAGFWRLPLVRLDLSAVFGQPRPEESLKGALRVAEAMAPMVLWIDEIEKGFDQGGEGPAARLLGGMVTWLQEKKNEVFVVATANKVEHLPPELPRKGRFDEIFFVDLPDPTERRAILDLHLRRRGLNPGDFALDTLVRETDKMTGSELEQLVVAAMYSAFSRGDKTTVEDIQRARRETVTLYETFEPEIKRLREWARKRARSASTDRRKIDMFDARSEGKVN